jgi:hypothetical protein
MIFAIFSHFHFFSYFLSFLISHLFDFFDFIISLDFPDLFLDSSLRAKESEATGALVSQLFQPAPQHVSLTQAYEPRITGRFASLHKSRYATLQPHSLTSLHFNFTLLHDFDII